MDEVTIRTATIDDIDNLVRLRIAFLSEIKPRSDGDIEDLSKACRYYFDQHVGTSSFEAWICESARSGESYNEIIATGMVIFFDRLPRIGSLSGREALLQNMYTLPAWRGRGIGATLLEVIIDGAKRRGACEIGLVAVPAARRLYERAGFEAAPDRMVLHF